MLWKIYGSFELLLVILSVVAAVPVAINEIQNKNEVIDKAATTEIQVSRLRYLWTIKNLHFNDYIKGQSLNSSQFSAETDDNCKWHLFIFPKGQNTVSKDHVSLFIDSDSCNVNANIYFSFVNAGNEHINNKTFSHDFSAHPAWGYNTFAERDFLINEENRLYVNNSLTIICEIQITLTSDNNSENIKKLPMIDDVGKDLEFLLNNELYSDIVISSGEKQFPALKGILAARSPIFRARFEQDTSEKKLSRIDVDDVSDDVLMEMLRYIYTGEVSNLTDLAPKLLVAAEKYQLVGLKTMCENSMSLNLTVENAIEYYKFGDKNSAEFLKSQAKDFIVAHAANIIPTLGFKSIFEGDPVLLDKIFATGN